MLGSSASAASKPGFDVGIRAAWALTNVKGSWLGRCGSALICPMPDIRFYGLLSVRGCCIAAQPTSLFPAQVRER